MIRVVLRTLPVVLLALAAALLTGSARATVARATASVVFDMVPTNHNELQVFAVRPDGSHLRQVTHDPLGAQSPSVSADAKRIAFVRFDWRTGFVLFVMNADGTGEKRLTDGSNPSAMDPAFSPDGRELVFASRIACGGGYGTPQVWMVGVNGQHSRAITHDCDLGVGGPTFAPSGRAIAFTGDNGFTSHIYLVDPRGTHVQQLTTGAEHAVEPSFSPNGKQIVFSRSTPSQRSRLFVIGASGTGQHQLRSHHPCGDPSFSPDGRKILAVCTTSRAGVMVEELVIMNADGTNPRSLKSGNIASAVWASTPH